MLPATSPIKKLKSSVFDNINSKTSVMCTSVPESLFDPTAAKKHFSKFGRIQKIRLFPKRQMCIIEYDQPTSTERAVLNAGAFDGFMFDVTRIKARVRRKSKKEDDPDWVPDSDVEEELSAMSRTPTYRVTRQKPMDTDMESSSPKAIKRITKQLPLKKMIVQKKQPIVAQIASGIESPVLGTSQSSVSTYEAASELHQLRSKVSLTPDEQWRTLDARDRILRSWGGAGSRVREGGATLGTCPDMCPEKELLHRQAEHQVMTLETIVDSDGLLEPWRAVKQYSRSSADQEIPMCYELRPAPVLMRTCAYLLHEIADTTRQVTLSDWFHFMWDRFRGIRKDITQQALCCAESVALVEMCARFHAHCAARLADLEHTQFDQKLNTDNLTKCLQTLKHMYADVTLEQKPREAEFRGYIALLNLGDANFWWEIKQLPVQIQKSEPIIFAIKVFNALDNNNYVRFFRLVKEKATYLQACILLRYFNDVRARALARIIKAYAPRGASRFPVEDLMNSLAFESVENMKSFINHYGLRFSKTDDTELAVILDRNQFIEDSDPYPVGRAILLIESKRQSSVGELIAGGALPNANYKNHTLYSSFSRDGKLKESALIAEDLGYNTVNDSNKDIQALKADIQRLAQESRSYINSDVELRSNLSTNSEITVSKLVPRINTFTSENDDSSNKEFLFTPAIPVASTDVIKNSPENKFTNNKNIFSFSKPEETIETSEINIRDSNRLFGFGTKLNKKVISNSENKDSFQNERNIFKGTKPQDNLFKKPQMPGSIFGQTNSNNMQDSNSNLFLNNKTLNNNSEGHTFNNNNIFKKNESLFTNLEQKTKLDKGNIFAQAAAKNSFQQSSHIFSSFDKTNHKNIFGSVDSTNSQADETPPNGEFSTLSPGSFFKNVCKPPNGSDDKSYLIFHTKNKPQSVANNIFNSINTGKSTVYDFENNDASQNHSQLQQFNEEILRKEQERKLQEKLQEDSKKEELRLQEEIRHREEQRRKEEEKKKQEQRQLEEKRKKEEEIRKQEELLKRIEEEKKAELKRKAEEERRFKEQVEIESLELTESIINEIRDETVTQILKDEVETFSALLSYAGIVSEDIITELSNEICHSEIKAIKFYNDKIMRKWFYVWRRQCARNFKRRCLLEDTPVWLTDKSPEEEATLLRRRVEVVALKNMKAIHRGYKFNGELKQWPSPEPFNIMEIIRSRLLKRMKQINYPYDKCFFWKVTVVSPGGMKWLFRKINIENWLLDVFSDRKKHDISNNLIHVSKQSWNNLMNFAISVSLLNSETKNNCGDAIEGTNGIVFYTTETEQNFIENIKETLKSKYPYQIIPITVVMPNTDFRNEVELLLNDYITKNIISSYKIFILDPRNIIESLSMLTKSALKWMAKMYPQTPPLEIDYLKSMCQRYLGNEIWCKLKSVTDSRMASVLKDLNKLIRCYNIAVDKLTAVITDEDLFNYTSFPLEFKRYLDDSSPYPKPFEFIPSSVKNSENVSMIKDIMKQLKLPHSCFHFEPMSVVNMQQQMRQYCRQIGWFKNPEEVVCKAVAELPNQFSNVNMTCEEFTECFLQYDLTDFLDIIVYEKINSLKTFRNGFAIYNKSVLDEYRNAYWLTDIDVLSETKHKALDYEDDIDFFVEAKRRKIEINSLEYLELESKDSTLADETIKQVDESISRYDDCNGAVKQLEKQIEEELKRSVELENILRTALSDV